eukprot:1341842-Amphidinium_carterae.1
MDANTYRLQQNRNKVSGELAISLYPFSEWRHSMDARSGRIIQNANPYVIMRCQDAVMSFATIEWTKDFWLVVLQGGGTPLMRLLLKHQPWGTPRQRNQRKRTTASGTQQTSRPSGACSRPADPAADHQTQRITHALIV